jgi:phage minor structural protein
VIYILDRKEKVVGVLNNATPSSCPYYDDIHTENIITGVQTYDFTIPADHETSEVVEVDGYVIIRDLDKKMQMFQIKEISEIASDFGYKKEVLTEHIAVAELLGNPIRPATLTSSTLENTMNYILQGTGWSLGEVDYAESVDFEISDYSNALKELLYATFIYRVEVQYEIVFKNGKVTNRLVHVTKERGNRTLKHFTYTKDLGEVVRVENTEGLVTALIGVGRGDVHGERLTLAGYSYPIPAPYEKPKEADWIGNEDALQLFGKNGKHIFDVYFDDNATNQHMLYVNTLEELKKRSKPSVSYEMKVATLERITGMEAEKVRIGDTIIGNDTSFKPRLVVEARVLELKRSYTSPENDEVILGSYKPIKLGDMKDIREVQKLISKAEEKWNATSYKVEILSSNGLIFKSGLVSTVLQAKVYIGAEDITDTLDDYKFTWKRISEDTAGDIRWNQENFGSSKQVNITADDVRVRATFTCEVDI